MAKEHNSESHIWQEVMQYWDVTPVEYLGRRLNEHWLVASGENHLVLRGYSPTPFAVIYYELEVLRRLHTLGWPVPVLVKEPVVIASRTWCLFTRLPGTCRPRSLAEGRKRGRLLAELHGATATLVDLGQRAGFCYSDELIRDPELTDCLRAYEHLYLTEGHVLRWHLEQAQAAFAIAKVEEIASLVLHSDFTPWNLLFEDERLTGVLDFEFTHLNYRVADFAMSWRGIYDEVIEGYREVAPLTDLEMALIVPVFWSYLFHGVKDEVKAMLSGQAPEHDFAWQVKLLLRRSKLLGRDIPAYPGAKGV